jgi:hypothetical protein
VHHFTLIFDGYVCWWDISIGQDITKRTTLDNTDLVNKYFETNNLAMNPTKAHYILFQTKQCRQESELEPQ